MKYPVFLKPGNDDGLLLDAYAVKGANFTLLKKSELNDLNKLALVKGVTVYITDEQKTYRWDGSQWNEVTVTDAYSKAEIDNKINDLRTSFQYWNISYTEKDGGDN